MWWPVVLVVTPSHPKVVTTNCLCHSIIIKLLSVEGFSLSVSGQRWTHSLMMQITLAWSPSTAPVLSKCIAITGLGFAGSAVADSFMANKHFNGSLLLRWWLQCISISSSSTHSACPGHSTTSIAGPNFYCPQMVDLMDE